VCAACFEPGLRFFIAQAEEIDDELELQGESLHMPSQSAGPWHSVL
jgi:hypothetical protein